MSLKFLNKTIVPATFIKDLGITIDHNLTYSKHISQLTSECMAKLCQINRVKHCFDPNALTYIICAVVMGTYIMVQQSGPIRVLQTLGNFKLFKILRVES